MGEKEWDPKSVFDLFGDELTRRILVLASERSVSAEELAATLDVSRPTIYRRVNALLEYDLVAAEREISTEGNDYQTFETTLERVTFEVDDGGYNIDIRMRQSLVNQFGAMWSDLGSSSGDAVGSRDELERTNVHRDSNHG